MEVKEALASLDSLVMVLDSVARARQDVLDSPGS